VADALINTLHGTDGSVLVEVRGEIDLLCAERLERIFVETATRRRPARIVVDLLHVTFIDSTGIGALVAGRNAAHALGIGFTVRQPDGFVAGQLRQTGLYEVLTSER